MANPYRGGSGTRVASGEGAPAPAPKPPAAKKVDSRPTNHGQPTFPTGMPPLSPGTGNPARGMGQGVVGPLAGNPTMAPPPATPPPGLGPGGPANWAQGGPAGSQGDNIINDMLPAVDRGSKKPGQGSGGRRAGGG